MKTNPNDLINDKLSYNKAEIVGGLTKREYFAALTYQALMNAHYSTPHEGIGIREASDSQIAQIAVRQADFLIEALNRK